MPAFVRALVSGVRWRLLLTALADGCLFSSCSTCRLPADLQPASGHPPGGVHGAAGAPTAPLPVRERPRRSQPCGVLLQPLLRHVPGRHQLRERDEPALGAGAAGGQAEQLPAHAQGEGCIGRTAACGCELDVRLACACGVGFLVAPPVGEGQVLEAPGA